MQLSLLTLELKYLTNLVKNRFLTPIAENHHAIVMLSSSNKADPLHSYHPFILD
jgi:hypothetical protein